MLLIESWPSVDRSIELFLLQTSHFTPQQAGQIFSAVKPKLSVIHHATVNEASREALISDVSFVLIYCRLLISRRFYKREFLF